MKHELKIKPEYFAAVFFGEKTFEIRNNTDRNFQVGDTLLLKAWDGEFNGDFVEKVVSYITDFEQKPGYVVLGLVNDREHELLEKFHRTGVAIERAISTGSVLADHPLKSRLELLANHHKREQELARLLADSIDVNKALGFLIERSNNPGKNKALDILEAHVDECELVLSGSPSMSPVNITETIRTAPERIWLQVGDQSHYHSEPFPSDTSEVSWCADSVVGCEVSYVRADLAGHVVSQPLGLLIQMTDILKMCRSALVTALENVQDDTGKGVIQYRIKLATKTINMAEHAIDAAAKANSGRLITEGQELELITVLQSIVNGFSDDPAHDAAALLKRITGEVPWAGDSFQLPPRQGGELCVFASPSSSPD
ncbi:hypothetical protein CF139_02595 [Aeromonas hydrophila]|uniref:ASCH/PUA domain-containing protein n=1 Tax=Aeromonas hydrophila TaxID=644 RepID=UPI0011160712|nr:ASCH/PUA domain-containing protein [Aeromonas hydrophila]TNH91748.1 hypothetical protein CF139_02595 [Aeromonas hydrophila]